MRISDWSSDVCSSDLPPDEQLQLRRRDHGDSGHPAAHHPRRNLLALPAQSSDLRMRKAARMAQVENISAGFVPVAKPEAPADWSRFRYPGSLIRYGVLLGIIRSEERRVGKECARTLRSGR